MLRQVAAGEDAAVDARVQRLDPAVQDLGEAGHLADLDHGHAGLAQGALAVPPVETSSTPVAARPAASSTRPVLSCTESSARRIGRKGIGGLRRSGRGGAAGR